MACAVAFARAPKGFPCPAEDLRERMRGLGDEARTAARAVVEIDGAATSPFSFRPIAVARSSMPGYSARAAQRVGTRGRRSVAVRSSACRQRAAFIAFSSSSGRSQARISSIRTLSGR